MTAFDLIEMGPELVVVVHDHSLAAAIRALEYAWQESPDTAERRAMLVNAVEGVWSASVTEVPVPTPS